jgi:Spy/CpxP family protein refolding chaperone
MKKILLISFALLMLSFMLFAEKAEKPMMNKSCPDCQGGNMTMAPGHDGMGMEADHEMMMKDLNLTKEQKKTLADMKAEHMKFMNTKQAEMKNLMIDKRDAMMNEQYDKAKLINKNITDLQLVIANTMVDNKSDMMKVLTAEQKAQMMEKMKSMPMGKQGMGKGMKGMKCMKDGKCKDKGMK